ncbi:MAG: hypothetical protein KatS3mg027_2309 [Bacteroidia bacterium]|nr:MAG: hypothetical protein KatS3mg027_2309 [Bacteroidia bacterium]
MFKLSENWITEGLMDVEYKQYLLLAYLRDIHEVFNNKILYPPFAELIEHHRNLKTIKNNLQQIKSSEKELKGIDWQNLQLIYQTPDNSETDVIEEIINFSIPKIEEEIQHGKEIFDEVEKKLKYTTVGLVPIYKDVGYFFVQDYPTSDFLVYKYELSSLYSQSRDGNIAYKKLKTEYIATYTLTLSKSLTSIKQEVIKQSPTPSNPAVYSFFPNQIASLEYTIIPIVKRMLMKLVA